MAVFNCSTFAKIVLASFAIGNVSALSMRFGSGTNFSQTDAAIVKLRWQEKELGKHNATLRSKINEVRDRNAELETELKRANLAPHGGPQGQAAIAADVPTLRYGSDDTSELAFKFQQLN